MQWSDLICFFVGIVAVVHYQPIVEWGQYPKFEGRTLLWVSENITHKVMKILLKEFFSKVHRGRATATFRFT